MFHRIPQNSPRSMVRGAASGLLLLTLFGAVWGVMAMLYMGSTLQIAALVLVGLVTLAFLAVEIQLLRYASLLPDSLSRRRDGAGRWAENGFGLVVGTEIGLIILAGILLARLHAPQLISPVIALVVGLHFIPLSRLFGVRAYVATGVSMIVLALIALVALSLGPFIGTRSADRYWLLLVDLGATLVLWLTALSVVRAVFPARQV